MPTPAGCNFNRLRSDAATEFCRSKSDSQDFGGEVLEHAAFHGLLLMTGFCLEPPIKWLLIAKRRKVAALSGPSRKKPSGLPLVLLAVILCVALAAQFRSGRSAPSGGFDYYLLSLSWAPEFCAQPGEAAANPRECASGRGIGFVVHGLWPEAATGKSPESCGQAKAVSKGLVNELLPYMPSPGLIQHEWTAHGTCSGLDQDAYFTKVLLARAAVQIPVQISSLGTTETESPAQIETQFEGSNPAFPKGSFRTACRAGALTEVRVCFDKALKGRSCEIDAGECPAPTVTIFPPR